ncbi:MAG: helical backbone metal receptor [Candidatus Latescibacterota bacterium]
MNDHPMTTTVTDDCGREHVFASLPRRIVSLVPSLTETIVYLAGTDRLAGVTKYCIHPQNTLGGIPRIGGTKDPQVEKIISLSPDLIIANKEENPRHPIEELERAAPVFLTYPRTVRQAIKTVMDLGILTGAADAAQQFAQSCDAVLKAVKVDGAIAESLSTACMIWRDPWMAAGPDTYVSDLLAVFGLQNILDRSQDRYPQTSLDEVIEGGAQLILLPDEPYEFGDKDKAFVEDHLRAHGATARVACIEGSYLTWFGSRTLSALGYLRKFKKTLL